MSYILDALRKADAQRASDPARGIHAQPAIAAAADGTGGWRREHLIWGGIAALVLLAATWFWFGAATAPAPTAPNPARVVASAPVVVPPPVVRVETAPATQVLPPAPAPAPAAAQVAAAPPKAPAAAVAAPAAAASASVAVPASAPTAPAADRIYSLAELPADVQQAMPKFNVSGGVYSENVAQRMLIVNGQVFNEGSEIATGVVLEQIRPRVALLKFRGLRIAQPY